MRVHIEVEEFLNLKTAFIFNDKEEGSIPASGTINHFQVISESSESQQKARLVRLVRAFYCLWLPKLT